MKKSIPKMLEMIEESVAELAAEIETFPETESRDPQLFGVMTAVLKDANSALVYLQNAAMAIRERGLDE